MIILAVLANTSNNTVEEISRKTRIKKEAVYHLLELLTLLRVVKKNGDKYDVDDTIRTVAQLLLDFYHDDEIIN